MPQPTDWYKDAIIYALDVATYCDANGDGIGDFPGLTQQLDYIADLGATCLWVLPFYVSPGRDNGYDVADHLRIDPRFGTLDDFAEFVKQADRRGIRVMLDLVVNHTSDQHPWFQEARRDPTSRYRDYYVWSENPPGDEEDKIVFPGPETSIRAYDEVAGAYYWHRFYRFEPDLNPTNPAVRREICRIIDFWLKFGVAAFRLDAAPYLVWPKDGRRPDHPFALYEVMCDTIVAHDPGGAMMAEADVVPTRMARYVGDGGRLQMMYSFFVNMYLFLALAREQAAPIKYALASLPSLPPAGQWVHFLRNHDELDLERLSEAERNDVYRAFAPQPEMRIYGRGIRRRLSPMLGGDRRRLELAHSLLFSLPGTPIVRYGGEIGMGDDLSLRERNSVRTPMQWSSAKNAGFSAGYADDLERPVISSGRYSYRTVNVEDQRRDPDSLLNWMKRAIAVRKATQVFGRGDWKTLEADDDRVLALRGTYEGETVLTVHNLSREPCETALPIYDLQGMDLVGLLDDARLHVACDRQFRLTLDGYAYHWFRVDPPKG